MVAAWLAVAGLQPLLTFASLPAQATETWEKLDRRLKPLVYQVNVGIKIRVGGNLYAQLTDLSPRYHYPVFGTTADDKGFRVVGFGTSFPIRTSKSDKTYFLTNRHVIDSGKGILEEAQRFFAALRLHAEQNTGFNSTDNKYKELLNTVNLSQKKDMNPAERLFYSATVDAIWETYDKQLSKQVDPTRAKFNKYLAQTGFDGETGYYMHAPGPITQAALPVQVYKSAPESGDVDLAVLACNNAALPKMDFDPIAPAEGQEIQVIGYPLASDQIDLDASKYYAPTFSTGRVSRVAPHLLQFDAPVSTGNSGGPVVSQRGKVVGVVVRRAVSQQAMGGQIVQSELTNFGGAITIPQVKAFAPELFAAATRAR